MKHVRVGVMAVAVMAAFALVGNSLPGPAPPVARAAPLAQNGCGPDWFPVPDGPFFSELFTWWHADIFLDACNTHDVCYATSGKSQLECDNEFLANLMASCGTWPGIIDPTCPAFAQLYYTSVLTFGGIAFEDAQGPPQGEIISTAVSTVDGDELVVMVAMVNRGGYGEFDVKLYSEGGDLIDEEPDTYWSDVLGGGTAVFALTTNWDPFWNLFDVGNQITVVLSEEESGEHDREILTELPMPQAEIDEVRAYRIDDWWGDDEFEACVVFTNTGLAEGEFDVKLYNAQGTFIDEEPDGYWADVDAGAQKSICVGTNWIYESWSDLKGEFTVVVNEEHLGEMARYTGSLDGAAAADSPHAGAAPYFAPDGPILSGWEILETNAIDPPPPDGQGHLTVRSGPEAGYAIVPAGGEVAVWTWSGGGTFPLPPGNYEIRDGQQNRVGETAVQPGMETVIEIDMGRMVVSDAGAAGFVIYPAGDEVAVWTWIGDGTFGLYAGEYEIASSSGDVVWQGTVEPGVTTTANLPTGSLVVSDPGGAGYAIYPAGDEVALWTWIGDGTFGLYAGGYEIRRGDAVLGQVTILRGETTTFSIGS